MKKILTIAVILLAASVLASNQNKDTNTSGQNTSEEQAVSQLERELAKAYVQGDAKTLDRILADDLTATPNEGFVLTKQDYLKYLKRLNGLTADFPRIDVRVYGNAAVASGLVMLKYNFNGREGADYFCFTDTFVKRQSGWQLVATQQQSVAVWKTRYLQDSELKVLNVQDCSQEASLKSLNGDVPTLIRFTNATSQPIMVYWLNFDGRRDPSDDQIETIKPGQQGGRMTFVTHPFLVTDASGKCLAIYQPTREPSLAIIK
jgi:ketosteroid isomerase-like protein